MHHKRHGSPTNSDSEGGRAAGLQAAKKNGKGTTAERINIFTGADKGAAADVLHRLTSERFAIPVPITNSGLDCR